MNSVDKIKLIAEKVSSLEDLANRFHSKARRFKLKADRGDKSQLIKYHEAMIDYHDAMQKHSENEGLHSSAHNHEEALESHEEALKQLTRHSANESVEEITERIDKPQGHEHIGDPISDDSKEGKGRQKKMMGQTSSLVQTIAKIISKG